MRQVKGSALNALNADEYAWLAEQLDGVSLPVEHTWRGPTLHDVESLLALGTKERLAPAALRAARIHGADAVMWAFGAGWHESAINRGSADPAH